MPINIKELFKSDLDANSTAWWSSQKINKINHNFNLLKSGTIGPKGDRGIDGEPGFPGISGEKGYMGPLGPQGITGADAIGIWSHVDDGLQRTLFPTSFDGLDTNIKIGRLNVVGHSDIKVDAVLDIKDSEATESVGTTNYNTRIKLLNAIGEVDIDTQLGVSLFGVSRTLNISPIHNTPGELTAINLIAPNSITLNNTVEISTSNININTDFTSSTPSGDFIINTDSLVLKLSQTIYKGSVLMAADTNGSAIWVPKSLAFNSAYPIGSIVKISTTFFEDNFEIEYEIPQEEQGTGLVKFKWGRGKIGTAYEGWYLCHGKTWSNGTVSYQTPNLNKFNYIIEANGSGQPYAITEEDFNIALIAGYDITMLASTSGSNIDFTISNLGENDVYSTELAAGSGAYDATQMVHIVYLEDNDLTWDSTVEITRGNFINLGVNALNSSEACQASQIEFELFPALSKDYPAFIINYWNDTGADFSDKILYSVDSNRVRLDLAPAGWYSTGQVARYWDPELGTNGEFDLINVIECTAASDIYFDTCLDNLNIEDFGLVTPGSYTLDGGYTNDLSLASSIEMSGSPAAAGWYYQTNETDIFIKRYWTGLQFEGVTITKRYVYRIKNANNDFWYYNFGLDGCEGCCLVFASNYDSSLYQIPTYLASDTIISNPITTQLSEITGSIIYTLYDWNVYIEEVGSISDTTCNRGLSLISNIGFVPFFIYNDVTDPNLEYVQIGSNGRLFNTVASCDPCGCGGIE